MAFLETGTVDREMAGLTAVDLSHRLIKAVAVELIRETCSIWGSCKTEWTEFQGTFSITRTHWSRSASVAKFVFDLLGARADFFDLFFELIALIAYRDELLIEGRFLLIQTGDDIQIRLRIALLLHRMIMLVPGFLELALDVDTFGS
jgi:hypothetical protein